MKNIKKPLLTLLGTIALGVACAAPAVANEALPEQAITYVVPFSPGGATDIIGRTYSSIIGKTLGESVVVENRPGTGGSLGSAYASRAKPDGYTIVGGTISSHSINVSMYPSIGYDPITSFTPVILTGTLPTVVVVRADSDIKSVDDLINRAKTKQDGVTFGSDRKSTRLNSSH